MIERIVLLKLKPEFVPQARPICTHVGTVLATIEHVRGVGALPAADERTAGAWDLVIRLQFDDMDAVDRYLPDPMHRALVDEYLKPRTDKLEAFNFDLGPRT